MLPLLVVYMLGIPIPSFRSKVLDDRFPCEHCACGCSSAAHCWEKCCCFSDEEKLRWAEENDVQPPEFLTKRVAAAKSALNAKFVRSENRTSTESRKATSCCASKSSTNKIAVETKASCCSKCKKSPPSESATAVAKRSCCNSEREKCAVTSDAISTYVDEKLESDGAQRVVLLDSALKCQGIQMALLLFSNVIVPSSSDYVADFFSTQSVGKLDLIDLHPTCIYLDLDGPVPRSA